jgi:hypothetical protein
MTHKLDLSGYDYLPLAEIVSILRLGSTDWDKGIEPQHPKDSLYMQGYQAQEVIELLLHQLGYREQMV